MHIIWGSRKHQPFVMLSRNIVSRRSTLIGRAIRAKSTQVQVDQSSVNGPIAADGRHEVCHEANYDNEMKWVRELPEPSTNRWKKLFYERACRRPTARIYTLYLPERKRKRTPFSIWWIVAPMHETYIFNCDPSLLVALIVKVVGCSDKSIDVNVQPWTYLFMSRQF